MYTAFHYSERCSNIKGHHLSHALWTFCAYKQSEALSLVLESDVLISSCEFIQINGPGYVALLVITVSDPTFYICVSIWANGELKTGKSSATIITIAHSRRLKDPLSEAFQGSVTRKMTAILSFPDDTEVVLSFPPHAIMFCFFVGGGHLLEVI